MLRPLETVGLAVVSRGDDFVFTAPDNAHKGEELRGDADDSARRLLRSAGVYNCDTAVVCGKGQGVSAWGEGYAVDPACGIVQKFTAHSIEGKSLSPS